MLPKTHHHRSLLDAAQRLMLSKGYPATRVDEICLAAGVTKGSFYHHFESKDDLARALVDYYFENLARIFEEQTWLDHDDPTVRIFAFLDRVLIVMKGPMLRHGCLLGSFALDLSETHPEIRAAIDERFTQLAGLIEPLLRDAMRGRPKRVKVTAPMLARQFVSVLQGGIVLAKAGNDHARLAEAMRCYKEMIHAVLAA